MALAWQNQHYHGSAMSLPGQHHGSGYGSGHGSGHVTGHDSAILLHRRGTGQWNSNRDHYGMGNYELALGSYILHYHHILV